LAQRGHVEDVEGEVALLFNFLPAPINTYVSARHSVPEPKLRPWQPTGISLLVVQKWDRSTVSGGARFSLTLALLLRSTLE
jgi:hypothetical protein